MKNKYLILINKENPMINEKDYKKIKCESIYKENIMLEEKTYNQFLKLKNLIKELGYIIDIESGYRSSNYQKKVWDDCVLEKGLAHTNKYVAKPGYSEHQSGLALDFVLYENGSFYIEHKMTGHPVLEVVEKNAYKFGFIIRYPKGKENITGYNYEAWHLRYIDDINIAKYIYENKLCLEEYINL